MFVDEFTKQKNQTYDQYVYFYQILIYQIISIYFIIFRLVFYLFSILILISYFDLYLLLYFTILFHYFFIYLFQFIYPFKIILFLLINFLEYPIFSYFVKLLRFYYY